MQVFRHGAGGYWRASKRWCKTLPVGLVDKALVSFAHNGEPRFIVLAGIAKDAGSGSPRRAASVSPSLLCCFLRFVGNGMGTDRLPGPAAVAEHGLRPVDVYGGPAGAISQLEALESWFAMQRDFHFYSSSGGWVGGWVARENVRRRSTPAAAAVGPAPLVPVPAPSSSLSRLWFLTLP